MVVVLNRMAVVGSSGLLLKISCIGWSALEDESLLEIEFGRPSECENLLEIEFGLSDFAATSVVSRSLLHPG